MHWNSQRPRFISPVNFTKCDIYDQEKQSIRTLFSFKCFPFFSHTLYMPTLTSVVFQPGLRIILWFNTTWIIARGILPHTSSLTIMAEDSQKSKSAAPILIVWGYLASYTVILLKFNQNKIPYHMMLPS